MVPVIVLPPSGDVMFTATTFWPLRQPIAHVPPMFHGAEAPPHWFSTV